MLRRAMAAAGAETASALAATTAPRASARPVWESALGTSMPRGRPATPPAPPVRTAACSRPARWSLAAAGQNPGLEAKPPSGCWCARRWEEVQQLSGVPGRLAGRRRSCRAAHVQHCRPPLCSCLHRAAPLRAGRGRSSFVAEGSVVRGRVAVTAVALHQMHHLSPVSMLTCRTA